MCCRLAPLSVSSNGSTWVKQASARHLQSEPCPFSILERIDVGETSRELPLQQHRHGLSVSSNGSTWVKPSGGPSGMAYPWTFSILERIDVGETFAGVDSSV